MALIYGSAFGPCFMLPVKQNARCRRGIRTSAASKEDKKYPVYGGKEGRDFPLEELKKMWEKGWAPWEEVHPPEGRFALRSLNRPKNEQGYPILTMEDMDVLDNKEPKPVPTPVEVNPTVYDDKPIYWKLIPPRDWPPPGWKVDPVELAFIRETHTMYFDEPSPEDVISAEELSDCGDELHMPRWRMFLKQYDEWVAANRDKLEKEALLVDPEYEPGRRRTGDDYAEGMYELPFIYPGQHYSGIVSCIDLENGAFVNIGAVHDGWVCILGNDWFKLRHIIQVGMYVHVEVIAKRDPYRYRYPIELRFVYPNVDRSIFWRYDYPPILIRPGDDNQEEVERETMRPHKARLNPSYVFQADPREMDHPYVAMLLEKHTAEQLVLDIEDGVAKPDDEDWLEYITQGLERRSDNENDSDSESESSDDEDSIQAKLERLPVGTRLLKATEKYRESTYVTVVDEATLDLVTARKEREIMRAYEQRLKESSSSTSVAAPATPKRLQLMKQLNEMHRQRCIEEAAAFERDCDCRTEVGLRADDERFDEDALPKNKYNPRKKVWQNTDYISDDPKSWKYAKLKKAWREQKRKQARKDAAAAAAATAATQKRLN